MHSKDLTGTASTEERVTGLPLGLMRECRNRVGGLVTSLDVNGCDPVQAEAVQFVWQRVPDMLDILDSIADAVRLARLAVLSPRPSSAAARGNWLERQLKQAAEDVKELPEWLRTPAASPPQEFCRVCGASIPPRFGEGTGKCCDPIDGRR